jgi:hypothetical protein
MIHATSPQGMAATSGATHASQATLGATHASQATNPREAGPDKSERDTWTAHGSMVPPERLNRFKNTCTPGTDLRVHRTATLRKHTQSGAHLGSADPRIGRTNLGSVDPGLPHGTCPLVLEAIPGCFTLSCVGALVYKWKGRVSFLTNTSYPSSLTFGF